MRNPRTYMTIQLLSFDAQPKKTKTIDDYQIHWRFLTGLTLSVCLMPMLLISMGADFSTAGHAVSLENMSNSNVADTMHQALRGSFTHTILEWSAICAAIIVCVLAFVQHRLTSDPSLPIIGIALVCAGAMDGFHTLAADRLIESVADNNKLIPFTWAICRLFNALILLIGVGLFVFKRSHSKQKQMGWVVPVVCLAFVGLAYITINLCATSDTLPQTMFADASIKRPYDIYPLAPYALCALVVLPMYIRRNPSDFAYALLLSMIPQIATQLYMAFGSFQLHDSAFNIAHSLKVLGYAIPAIGLLSGYVRTFQQRQIAEQAVKNHAIELTDVNKRLEESMRQTQAASEAKSSFLANMSHEIRTPMNGVLGITQILAESELTAEQSEYVHVIQQSGNSLLAIINDVLDFSKIEANKIEIESIPTPTASLFQGAIDIVNVNASAKGVTVSLNIPEDVPATLMLDPQRIRQITLNLASNAIKFTEDGSVHINVSYRTDASSNGWLSVSVQDTGIGMKPETIELLFNDFTQADASTTRQYGGTGLGLAISRRLATLMGGDITVQSVVGEGSCFTLEIPAKAVARNATLSKDHVVDALTKLHGHILLAEDNRINQMVAVRMLQKLGLTVDVANNGKKAIQMMRDGGAYDLILMDCHMPVIDGYKATCLLRDSEESGCQEIPIIALTANAMPGDKAKCFEVGMSDYLTKPIEIKRLHQMLSQWLEAGELAEQTV